MVLVVLVLSPWRKATDSVVWVWLIVQISLVRICMYYISITSCVLLQNWADIIMPIENICYVHFP